MEDVLRVDFVERGCKYRLANTLGYFGSPYGVIQ